MSLSSSVAALATRVATEINALREDVADRTPKVWPPIDAGAPTPAGAQAGDIILRRQP